MSEKVFLEDPIWFSPLNVVHHANELEAALSQEQKKTGEYKKVMEARAVAIMLTGLITIENIDYWMQIVDDKHGSPDIRTVRYAEDNNEKFDNLEQEDVEVVEYEAHTKTSIPEFLAQTKFAKGKGYDDKTHILCYVGADVNLSLPPDDELKKQMSIITSACPTALLIESSKNPLVYKLIKLNPDVGTIKEFNLEEELKKLTYSGVMTFKRGSKRPIEAKPEEKHYPFENIGYVPNEQGKY
jgi:hypothetical protein